MKARQKVKIQSITNFILLILAKIISCQNFHFVCVFVYAASTPGPQAVSMVKTQKKQRKEGPNDFENTSRDRDDVQSPAYSDISDDSTPVAESEISGKHCKCVSVLLVVCSFFFSKHCLEAVKYN